MQILRVPLQDILIPSYRQRKEIEGEALGALMQSIESHGLLQPIVVRLAGGKTTLVAGERRLRALQNMEGMGGTYRFGGSEWPAGEAPCVSLGELDPLAAESAELEENIRRVDLTFQERIAATGRLADLRRKQAESVGGLPPTLRELSSETRGSDSSSSMEDTRRELILSQHLHKPDIAKAKNLDEAWKALKLEESRADFAARAAQAGLTHNASVHSLVQADCLEWCGAAPDAVFDVILTDPPYGMGADNFGDAGGRLRSQSHQYADNAETWHSLIRVLAPAWFRIAKPQAHLYVCCDIDGFHFAREQLAAAGWWVHRTPFINFKRDGSRVPWPQHGPQRKWELVLYANKGKKPVTHIYPDVIETKGDENFGHGAQKPVELYTNLLKRSVRPGDLVLDCFGGTGTIIPACHELQCRATYVELDPVAYGIALKRLESLK